MKTFLSRKKTFPNSAMLNPDARKIASPQFRIQRDFDTTETSCIGQTPIGKIIGITLGIAVALILTGCLGMPPKVKPVENFEVNRYLGTWYEIARLDHSFERGLERVTAEYSMRDDGGISVLNRGYDGESGGWKETEGKAYFVDGDNTGYLKVSFFGPFYGSYVVFEIDREGYEYAFVSGPDTSYLWLLSRSQSLQSEIIERFIQRSKELGFDTSQLIFVNHKQEE